MEDKVLSIFKTKSNINKALVFVDYEYWFYTYKNLLNLEPNTKSWRQELDDNYSVLDILVFLFSKLLMVCFETPILSANTAAGQPNSLRIAGR